MTGPGYGPTHQQPRGEAFQGSTSRIESLLSSAAPSENWDSAVSIGPGSDSADDTRWIEGDSPSPLCFVSLGLELETSSRTMPPLQTSVKAIIDGM